MAVSVKTTKVAIGQWVEVAEFRPGRQSLWIEFLGGALIFSNTTNLPTVNTLVGKVPAGTYHNFDPVYGWPVFHLSRRDDGELVEQAWYAWRIDPANTAMPKTTKIFVTDGTLQFKDGNDDVELTCIGPGGACDSSDNIDGPSGGGGGGAWVRTKQFNIPPGSTLTISCEPTDFVSPFPQPKDTWASLTGAAPTTLLEGCRAQAGRNAPAIGTGLGGAGGLASASLGTEKFSGGAGGGVAVYVPATDAGGGGGGAGADDAGNGANGQAGVNTSIPGARGGLPGGGDGGSIDGGFTPAGLDGASGGGIGGPMAQVATGFTPAGQQSGFVFVNYFEGTGTIATTWESYRLPPDPPPKKPKIISAPLPRLSNEGKRHLRSLREKLKDTDPDYNEDTNAE